MKWHKDPSFVGPRERAFVKKWQLIVYEDDGRWEVRHNNQVVDSGTRGGRPAVMFAWLMALATRVWRT